MRHVVDPPDFAAKGDDVRGVPNELERSRLVEAVDDDGHCSVLVDSQQCTRLRQRRRTVRGAFWKIALRQGVQRSTQSKLHVDVEPRSGRYCRHAKGLRVDRHHLACLWLVWNGSGLRQVDLPAVHGKPGGHDIAEGDEFGDAAVQRDAQHPVVMPISDQEATAKRLQRVLNTRRDEERCARRICDGEGADIGDWGDVVGPVDTVDSDDADAAYVSADEKASRPSSRRPSR
jgi:hypothetical protein